MRRQQASDPTIESARQTTRFMMLYALAWSGGAIGYVPFLTLLLPAKVTELTGADAVAWLSYIAFVGAISASVANVGFGWLSDYTRSRRAFVFAGLIVSCLLLMSVAHIDRPGPLLLHIALWQFALNMMLSPLAAWAGDCVPNRQKGRLGGLLSFAPAIGGLSGALVTMPALALSRDAQPALVAGLVAACVLPVLFLGRPVAMPQLMVDHVSAGPKSTTGAARGPSAVAKMWASRLLIQIAEASLFAFLLLWLRSLDEAMGENETARLYSLVVLVAVPLALWLGRWADKRQRPILPLAGTAVICVIGLAGMAISGSLAGGVASYMIFGVAGAVFLSLHSAQTLRVLPRARTRGRDLGFFNLTNTVPSLIMPWLTLALVPTFGFAGLFALLAAMAALASTLLFSVSRRK